MDFEDNQGTSLEDKEERFQKAAFVLSPADQEGLLPHGNGTCHQRVDETTVQKALFDQSQKKASDPDRLNFSMLRILWQWDAR